MNGELNNYKIFHNVKSGSIATFHNMKKSYEWCMEVGMTPVQKEVFLIVDEYWKLNGCSPTYREIAEIREKPGLGNTKKIIERLVKIGVLKKVDRMSRTVRPVYINFRNIK
jgi:predicted glycosyl hydrolase (DUF1957 family)